MHTAAPWHVNDMNPTTVLADRYSIGARAVADCTPPVRSGISEDEAKANARLIAAAPELLNALTDCAFIAERGEPLEGRDPKAVTNWIAERARAAIAKATGAGEAQ